MFIKPIIRTSGRSVKRRFLIVVALCGLLLLVAVGVLYEQVDMASRIDEARQVDAIIILGSAVWPGGRPSPSLYARTQHAIQLYQAGYAPYMILCGGVGQNPPAEAEVMRELAEGAGVRSEALSLDAMSHSTEENLANAKALMDAHGWRTALIVSDPFHLLRAQIIARDLGIEAYRSPAVDSPTYTTPNLRVQYTAREAIALIWYYASRVAGEPTWLYAILKGRI
jgi:uncharacterized SAM-binding protein YcdF (DUF218 family)